MSGEQQILAGLAVRQIDLAKDFLAVGELGMAKNYLQQSLAKIEMIEAAGPNHQPASGQKRTGSFLEIDTTTN